MPGALLDEAYLANWYGQGELIRFKP